MYEYKFVKIEFKKLSGNPSKDYREVINNQAKDGWRFVQIFSPDLATSGVAVGTYYELIFERSLKKWCESSAIRCDSEIWICTFSAIGSIWLSVRGGDHMSDRFELSFKNKVVRMWLIIMMPAVIVEILIMKFTKVPVFTLIPWAIFYIWFYYYKGK